MDNLKELHLSRCSKISDSGIKHLISIQSLEKLHISEIGLTSAGVNLLSSLSNLDLLDLGGIPVTDEALLSLQVLLYVYPSSYTSATHVSLITLKSFTCNSVNFNYGYKLFQYVNFCFSLWVQL